MSGITPFHITVGVIYPTLMTLGKKRVEPCGLWGAKTSYMMLLANECHAHLLHHILSLCLVLVYYL